MGYEARKTERKIDIRPPRQVAEERHRNAVRARFLELKGTTVEGTSDWRIMVVMAEEMGCTTQNIRNLLLKTGTIQVRRKTAAKKK